MKNNQKVLLAALFGAAAGMVAGVLIAPDSGKKTRKKLKRKAEAAKREIEDNIQEFSSKGKANLEEIKKTAAEILS